MLKVPPVLLSGMLVVVNYTHTYRTASLLPRQSMFTFFNYYFGLINYTQIMQGYFTGTEAITVPVPMKQPWKYMGN